MVQPSKQLRGLVVHPPPSEKAAFLRRPATQRAESPGKKASLEKRETNKRNLKPLEIWAEGGRTRRKTSNPEKLDQNN